MGRTLNANTEPLKSGGSSLTTLTPQAELVIVLFLGALAYAAYRVASTHPLQTAGLAIAALLAAGLAARLVARARDRREARRDPQGGGVIIGAVRRDGRLAHPRPYVLPWPAFNEHVILDGPTGSGKTFTFIEPILRAFCARKRTGIFYLDGKGDPVHDRPGVRFDHVFNPQDPASSASWNPLAGDDPIAAAAQFAAALFPEAVEAGANFYEAKAVYAITKVAPAMALTGFGVAAAVNTGAAAGDSDLVRELIAAGLDDAAASRWADRAPTVAAAELARFRQQPERSPEVLERAIAQASAAQAGQAPAAVFEVTPVDLDRVLFGAGQLQQLVDALGAQLAALDDGDPLAATLAQLRHDIAAIARQDDRDRAAVFQNLQNRLGYFLTPPFLELCSLSDFRIADVAAGAKLGFLLPTGAFPAAAKPLGRVALAQFKNAVLASDERIRKVAVLDEFHNFVSDDWGPFLNQARSKGGAAVMAMQSLADLPHHRRQAMLANARTAIVMPGISPDDAAYWADVFGKEWRPRASYSWEQHSRLDRPRTRHVRVDEVEEYRWTPTEIAELDPRYALIRPTVKRTIYPVAKVMIERG